MGKKKIRPLGQITTDLEPLLFELVDDHEMQLHELFSLMKSWAEVHYPEAIEEYMDGSKPKLRGIKYGCSK